MAKRNETLERKLTMVAVVALTLTMFAGGFAMADDATGRRARFLVLDSRVVESTENLQLTLGAVRKYEGNPLFVEDKPWEASLNNPYLSIIYDQEDKIYKCWYSMFARCSKESWITMPRDKRAWEEFTESPDRKGALCYATSTDGIRWEKPELGVTEFEGSKENNICFHAQHGVGVMKDPRDPDPQRRYKAILPMPGKTLVWFSPDGIRWTRKVLPVLDKGDTYNCVFWDPSLDKYVLFTRHWGGKKTTGRYGRFGLRQESRSESPDFLNWSKAEVVIEGLSPRMQIHDMPVVRHGDVYIGLVGLFDIELSKQWCELAWSPDSKQWHRIQPGTPLIPNGPQWDDCDWGCIFGSPPIFLKDEIRIYYGGDKGRFMSFREGSMCLARLRPDGFAGYEQIAGGSNKTGTLTSKPVTVAAETLCVTADVAMSGYVKVTLLDEEKKSLAEGQLIAKTSTDAAVEWKEQFSLAVLKRKRVRLQFELRDSKLYSFSFRE